MLRDIFGTVSFKVAEKALDVTALRHQVIVNNIANIDTPMYNKQVVKFESFLKKALDGVDIEGKMTHPKHIPINHYDIDTVKPKVITIEDLAMRNDLNNVDIDNEMADLAKNTIMYNLLTRFMTFELQQLNTPIIRSR